MDELIWVRIFAYSALPLLLATAHVLLDRTSRTASRRVETYLMYLLAISVGASGLGGAFGHLFLSDVVAEAVGWPAGSPFQLEMGFANLMVGVLGLAAVALRGGFRTATIIATTILGGGATLVHLSDIVATGNLAPGNTIQNIANLLDPVLLITLAVVSARMTHPDAESPGFVQWQRRQGPILAMAAVGVGVGFAVGFAIGALLISTMLGTLIGVGLGWLVARRMPHSASDQGSHPTPARASETHTA